ncbi:hypothetical protein THER5_1926 [Bifidobacterium thermacidophilum subsp. thermacidophilum]|uniref:Uncharacterized protein n=1 Tax=Bifidobacterium thermacidophilum subsp. thermacidophilum TaxID=79262 RepID=A0A087E3E1_9BIFI|nr:hypothetical protein THER5_1926 [Bifidobacterium thermacidophilum subsp. thermacidophilum]
MVRQHGSAGTGILVICVHLGEALDSSIFEIGRIRGLNRKSHADSQSSPRHAPCQRAIDHADNTGSAEYQQSTTPHQPPSSRINGPAQELHADFESRAQSQYPAPCHRQ